MANPNKPEAHADGKCKAEWCKKTEAQFSFCHEHFDWFKFGLISKEGKKVRDFDKKFDAFVAHGFGKVQKAA